MRTATELPRNADGSLAAWAWPGGYPIVYSCPDGSTLCPDCATRALYEGMAEAFFLATGWNDPAIAEDWQLVFYAGLPMAPSRSEMPDSPYIHYEGPAEWCDQCNATIESAYGDPDGPQDEE